MAAREAFVTLATNDSYSLGALVLGHSLRNVGTTRALHVLITPGVTQAMRTQLSKVYDVVTLVDVLDSQDEANLALLSRPELGVTLTKLHAWNLTTYTKAVFLDADALVLQNVDELFDRDELSAAPDVGWPDCFNTGVFVFRPSTQTFHALIEHAVQKGSFDGGDQGLLNSFFSDWATTDIRKHLPFIYNMVATVVYSYAPAFKEYGKNVKIVHFLGSTKPWHQQAGPSTGSSAVLGNFLQMWWDLFNSHVRGQLEGNLAGLAGSFSRLDLGSGSEARIGQLPPRQSQRSDWEAGHIDYLGEDRFDNIQNTINRSIGGGPTRERTPPQTQSQPQTSQQQQGSQQQTRQTSPPQQQQEQQTQQSSGESGQQSQSQSVRVESHAAGVGAVAGGAAAVQGGRQQSPPTQTEQQQSGQQQSGQQHGSQQIQQGRQPSPSSQTGQSTSVPTKSESRVVAAEDERDRLHTVSTGAGQGQGQAQGQQGDRQASPPVQQPGGHLQTLQSIRTGQHRPAQDQQGQHGSGQQFGQPQGQEAQHDQQGHASAHQGQQQQVLQGARQVSPPVGQQSGGQGQHTQQGHPQQQGHPMGHQQGPPHGQHMGRQATPPFQGGPPGQGYPAQQYQPGQQYQPHQGPGLYPQMQGNIQNRPQGPVGPITPEQFHQQSFPSQEFQQHVLQQAHMGPGGPQFHPEVRDDFYPGDPRHPQAGPGQPRHPQQGPGGNMPPGPPRH
ncbi:hypothetical protein RvY_10136 [Ramazzottius varieornatus]|uniref:glycogenin glucosyltransferase n=1 Tax=Ramazzottius varieornatus TaxID=947166 RepID=A0A1D1VGA2_RAMVA|nr:hypothetical protein RvY_10136 [Ramazzottius varieornatus]